MKNKNIHNYTLKYLLAEGSMAEVWYAENKIGKQASVKILKNDFSSREGVRKRFETEATVMVALDHRHIRTVYDYVSIEGRPAIIMEYLEGENLSEKLRKGQPFTNDDLIQWWNQAVEALNYTHSKGIVHCDIKPSNLFITNDGELKLLDFDIAKVRECFTMTQTMRTPLYMSPEQVKDSKHITLASDVYSLAVSFVQLITGNLPYDLSTESSSYDIHKSIVEQEISTAGLPAPWNDLLQDYLSKKHEERPKLKPISAQNSAPLLPQSVITTDNTQIASGATRLDSTSIREKVDLADNNAENVPKKKSKAWIFILLALFLIGGGYFYYIQQEQARIAEKNNLENQYQRGKKYYIEEKYTEALEWYRKAANQGHADAQVDLGFMYQNSKGVPQDYSQAVEWYRKAANQGDATAQFNLGFMYENGDGVRQDYSQAAEWFRKAANQGDADAQVNLGLMYLNGEGVPQDYSQAAEWFRKAANQGGAKAQLNLGLMYYNGYGVRQDYSQAAEWFRKAANQGHANAQFNLGVMYKNGEGVPQDDSQAVEWYRKAANQGHADAQVKLGAGYANGYGVPQDYSQAVEWYRKAANQGDADAQYSLGLMHGRGHGVRQDDSQAAEWFRKAANQGHAKAMKTLGRM